MNRLEKLGINSLAAAIALAAPNLVFGQLEEIVVTAERREQSEMETAISVEVFTMEQLALDKLQTVDDLQQMTPNLTVNYQGFTIQSVNIRGVGNAVGNPNIQPGVVVMKDGMIAGETVVIQQGFLDLETIEVLRGPQGTFVGQASTGGAVVINSARPNFDGVNGWVEGRMGDYADSMISGAVNIPLSDTLSTRWAFRNEERDSYYNNNLIHEQGVDTFYETGVTPGDTNSRNFRGSILWQPDDNFSVLGRAEFNTIRTDGTAPYVPNPRTYVNPNDTDPSFGTGVGVSRYYPYTEDTLSGNTDPYTLAYNLRDNHMESVTNLFSLDVSKTFDNGITFNSRTGYQDNDLRASRDIDATRANGRVDRIDVGPDNDYYNHEFTVLSPGDGRLNWLVGTAWYHRFTPVQVTSDRWRCGYNPVGGTVTECSLQDERPPQRLAIDVYTVQRHAGLFGQLTYDISDTLELEFGARNSWDNNVNWLNVHVMFDGGGPVPAGTPCNSAIAQAVVPQPQDAYGCIQAVSEDASYSKFKKNEPTYKIGLNWAPTDDSFIYGFYSRGYKSGGVDGGTRFENEIVDHYEFGYKGTLADGRMQIQAAAFYMDYQNMQQEAFLIRTAPGLQSDDDGIQNIGDSTIQGIELELDAQFGGFGMNFGMGYTDSELGGITTIDPRRLDPNVAQIGGNFRRGCRPGEAPGLGALDCFDYLNSAGFVDLSAADNLFSPELSWNIALNYAFELESGATIRPRLSYSYADTAFSSLFQQDDYFRTDEREILNVSLSYERDEWATYLFCNNCTEETFITSAVPEVDSSRVIWSAPRTVGVRFRYDF